MIKLLVYTLRFLVSQNTGYLTINPIILQKITQGKNKQFLHNKNKQDCWKMFQIILQVIYGAKKLRNQKCTVLSVTPFSSVGIGVDFSRYFILTELSLAARIVWLGGGVIYRHFFGCWREMRCTIFFKTV